MTLPITHLKPFSVVRCRDGKMVGPEWIVYAMCIPDISRIMRKYAGAGFDWFSVVSLSGAFATSAEWRRVNGEWVPDLKPQGGEVAAIEVQTKTTMGAFRPRGRKMYPNDYNNNVQRQNPQA